MMTKQETDIFQVQIELALANMIDELNDENTRASRREILAQERRRYEAAQERIEQGRFGKCCDCHDDIEIPYLQANPAAPFCEYCQEDKDARRQ